jgi:hypothetical protein
MLPATVSVSPVMCRAILARRDGIVKRQTG